MPRPISFGEETARRIIRQTRYSEARQPGDRLEQDGNRTVPRFYRVFELTEELSGGAGSTAAVKWFRWNPTDEEYQDSQETGEIIDTLGNYWGLEGERGRAAWIGTTASGPLWEVVDNPGQAVYYGTLDADTDSSPCDVSVSIDGNTRTVSAVLRAVPATGRQYGSGTGVYLGYFRTQFEIVSVVDCDEAET
jgi:hypothetical protein